MRILTAILILASAALAATPEDEIRRVLDTQIAAWNRGDIRGYMRFYAPDAVFVGSNVAHGAPEVEARYVRAYPTPEKMGHTTLTGLEVREIGQNAAYVVGRWRLERSTSAGGDIGGLFSLVVEKRGGEWLIILDHTH